VEDVVGRFVGGLGKPRRPAVPADQRVSERTSHGG
jgi:hypothetical protein